MNAPAIGAALAACLLASASAAADGALPGLAAGPGLPPALQALHERRERAHRALAFARVLAQLASGLFAALALDLAERPAAVALAVGGLVALLLVGLSESVARSAGAVGGPALAARLLPFITLVERTLAPVAIAGAAIDGALHRLLPAPPDAPDGRGATTEQFRQVVAAEAQVATQEVRILHGVFRMRETTVADLMVPRVDMVALDRETPWSEVVDRFRSSEHARIPVFRTSIDDVVGVLFAKDLLGHAVDDAPPDDWTTLVRPVPFIPATKRADVQLREFQASGMHIAIVADEFGGTAGLITIEDVLEEIVGDIRDEFDEDEAPVERDGDARCWVAGRVSLEELSDVLGVDLRHAQVSTVGGLVYERLGRVPRAGESLAIDGFRVVVERVVRRRVQRVYFERLPVDDEASGDARDG